VKLAPADPSYPPRLYHLAEPPVLTASGPLTTDRPAVAVVGARDAPEPARRWVHQLAYLLAKAGRLVVSGGAKGVDAAAHEGALAAGGPTWCVAPNGRGERYPKDNEALFAAIERAEGSRMIWPFPDGTPVDELTPRVRNGVLVALAECVVVVQAAFRSGSRNAIGWARHLDRTLYVVPGNPWDHAYAGSTAECLAGAEVVWSIPQLFDALALARPDVDDPASLPPRSGPKPLNLRPRRRRPALRQPFSDLPLFPVDRAAWSNDEKLVFSMLSLAPTQQDAVVERSGLPTSSVLTALLTLSLKDVVVEGPDGFFRRRNTP
jgi:DNA processing protein